jgi:glycosyltransferase involved in cell wall biosynthesis
MDPPTLAMYERLSKTSVPPRCPTVQHQIPEAFYNNSATDCSIGYTIFEMPGIPKSWVGPCNSMQAIWTGSEYSKAAFVASGVKVPVHILPHAIDIDAFSPLAEPWKIKNRRGFAFISVFDFTPRKAWKELLRAYWTAFKEGDDVCLILKVFFDNFGDEARANIIKKILRYRMDLGLAATAPILLYGHDVPAGDMPGLYRAADCYVGISREGFGLSFAEAMSCGLACIGPEVGGTREYMNNDNSFLVKYEGDEPLSSEMVKLNPAFEGLCWAKHSWEHLSFLMRHVFENREASSEKAAKGREFVTKNLTFESIGCKMASLLPE